MPDRFRLCGVNLSMSMVRVSPAALVMVTPLGAMRRVWLRPVSRSLTDCAMPFAVTVMWTGPLRVCQPHFQRLDDCCNVGACSPRSPATWLVKLVEACV